MFSAFKRSLPQISIFHNPSSPPSLKALALLQSAASGPYPPSSNKPLKFNLEVVERPPTADQIVTILSYLASSSSSKAGKEKVSSEDSDPPSPTSIASFLSSHPSSPSLPDRPHSAHGLAKLASTNPNAIKWPIVVDWTAGRAAVGSTEGVEGILEGMRRRRDGEEGEGEELKPRGWFS